MKDSRSWRWTSGMGLLIWTLVGGAAWAAAMVTMIDGDASPARTPGPGGITRGIVALDYNQRSVFIEFDEPTVVSRVVLKCDAAVHPGAGNARVSARKLVLYRSNDNKRFVKVKVRYRVPDEQTIVLDQFRFKTRYLKIHATHPIGEYAFVNHLNKMVPTFEAAPAVKRSEEAYHKLDDPLFESLLGDEPGPKRVLYWSGNCDDELGRLRPWFRAHAKRFGFRYVHEEELAETAAHHLVASGKTRPDLERHGILTWRFIIGDPGEAYVPCIDGMPKIFDPQAWLMDPRWQREYLKRAVERAGAREQWALCPGDETWEVFAINAVPKDKRYREVLEADKAIREKYGFGKYGMPESNEADDPFGRIAHRRWVSGELTTLFKKTYEAVKRVNPDTVMLSPDFASGVPAADIEAWAPYFDIFIAQTGNGASPYARRFAAGCDTKVLADLCGKPVWMTVQNATPPNYDFTVTPEFAVEMYSQVFRNGGKGLFLLASEWYERGLNHPKHAEPAKWQALLHIVDTVRNMNQVRLPEADCAILYSSDSLLTLRWAQMNNDDHLTMYWAYYGPRSRAAKLVSFHQRPPDRTGNPQSR